MNQKFHIRGLDCAEEVAVLKSALQTRAGVNALTFDVLNGIMDVGFESEKISVNDVISAVAKTGMTATPLEEKATAAPAIPVSWWDRNGRVALVAASGVFIVAGVLVSVAANGWAAALHPTAEHSAPLAARLIFTMSVFTGAWLVLPKALYSIRNLRPDMNLLMVAAAVGACVLGEWLEGATVAFLFALSLLLESWSVGRARNAVAALLNFAPPKARVITQHCKSEKESCHQHELLTDVAAVPVGSRILVKAGERFPLDGKVDKGESTVNEASITGESIPVYKTVGDAVYAGTMNGEGTLEFLTDKPSNDTTLARIIKLIGESQKHRAASEQWVEKFARYYTPGVMIAALAVAILPTLFVGNADRWIYEALALLVIACPCALVISTPVSIVAALASAARQGVLVKGGLYIEKPSAIRVVAIDKTGTLTSGEPEVTEVIPLSGHTVEELLSIAAAIESQSSHPLGRAIVRYAQQNAPAKSPAENFQTVQGKGATATLDGEPVWIGSHKHLEERGQETPEMHDRLEALSAGGASIVVVGNDHHVCGFIALSDSPREGAAKFISDLKSVGVTRVVMLTGDNLGTARKIAASVGVDEFMAELLPEQKVAAVEDLRTRFGEIAMIGDGINDAPALARADLGIAMGAGTDVALETADVALVKNNLSRIPWLFRHSRRTMGIIKCNIALSLFVKALFVVATILGHASLWAAIAADTGISILVVANALRLLRPERLE